MPAFIRSCTTWFQRRLGWSNSLRSWLERLAMFGVAGIIITLWWFRGRLTTNQHVFAWSLLLVATLALLRGNLLKLFGPVFLYELVRTSRQSRYFLLRCTYLFILLFILMGVYCLWTKTYDNFEIPQRAPWKNY